jgi:hypothetical protein
MRGRDHLSLIPCFVLIFTMARLARTLIAGLPHHATQRGNRREAIFFEDGDQEIYRDLLAEHALVTVRPVLDRVSFFADLLLEDRDEALAALRRAETTGRPVGTAEFVTGLGKRGTA